MIKRIEIENFKSLSVATIEAGELNLYTGINGSGKSSILQSILLIRQSYILGSFFRDKTYLILSGAETMVSLGTFKDVLSHNTPKDKEQIKFKIDFKKNVFEFTSEKYSPDNKDQNILSGNQNKNLAEFQSENIFSEGFQYLAAERINPSEDYPRFPMDESLGTRGEFTAHYLEKYGTDDITIRELSLNETPKSYSLIDQVNDWISEISESIEVQTKENLSTNRIELSYIYKHQDGTPSQNQKPQNVGFGITHTLPIIVAILSAKPGNLILIENPETHLHPRGQSRLAQLFALAAQNGIQLMIETHSDHIINGIRVAVKKEKIVNDKVFINYIMKIPIYGSTVKKIRIDSEGGLEEWPVGFFDEWDNLLNDLL